MARGKVNPRLQQIGVKILQRCDELGMSATELAIAADMTPATLSLIASGRRNPGVDKLCKIAEVLKVSLSYLQPGNLDAYSDIPSDIWRLVGKLKDLPQNMREMMINMFEAQLKSLSSTA